MIKMLRRSRSSAIRKQYGVLRQKGESSRQLSREHGVSHESVAILLMEIDKR